MKTGKKILLLVGILLLASGLTVLQIARHRGVSFSAGVTNSFGFESGVSVAYDQDAYTVLAELRVRGGPCAGSRLDQRLRHRRAL